MKPCREIQDMVTDAVDGTLKELYKERFYRHVSQCAACASSFHAAKSAAECLRALPLFDPGMKPFDAVRGQLKKAGETRCLSFPRRAGVFRWKIASAFCVLMLFFAYAGIFQKESFLSDTQMISFLMQHQILELSLPKAPDGVLSGYEELLVEESTPHVWETVLVELGL